MTPTSYWYGVGLRGAISVVFTLLALYWWIQNI